MSGDLSRRALAAAWLALALGVAGCGGDDGGARNGPTGAQTSVTTATSPPLATAPSAPEPPSDATGPSSKPKRNGGSEPIRIDATFTLRAGRLRPATVTTPSFVAVAVSVLNLDRVARVVVVRADRDYTLQIGPGRRAARLVPGQRAGTYPVLVGGRRRGAIVFGGEPGP